MRIVQALASEPDLIKTIFKTQLSINNIRFIIITLLVIIR